MAGNELYYGDNLDRTHEDWSGYSGILRVRDLGAEIREDSTLDRSRTFGREEGWNAANSASRGNIQEGTKGDHAAKETIEDDIKGFNHKYWFSQDEDLTSFKPKFQRKESQCRKEPLFGLNQATAPPWQLSGKESLRAGRRAGNANGFSTEK